MKNKIILLTLLMIFNGISAYTQQKLNPTDDQFEEMFGQWTDDTKPGLALGVLNDGKIEVSKSWGLANLEQNILINDESVFLFPGMSDQMIAFCVLLLEERGEWSLNDNIRYYLDFLPSNYDNIKIKNLMNHNGGIQDLNTIKILSGLKKTDDVSEEEFKYLLSLDLTTDGQIGAQHQFSKAGMRLLQIMLEQKTGLGINELMRKEIFVPLGMKNSFIGKSNLSIKNKVQGYELSGDDFVLDNNHDSYLESDQVYTSTTDMCLWVDNFWRAKVGSKELWKKMDGYVLEQGTPVKEKNQSMFLGQHRFWNFRGEAKYYQIGMKNGYAAKMIRYPDHDLAIVVLGNFGKYNGHLATACSELYLEPLFNEIQVEKTKPTFVDISSNQLMKYCGKYYDHHWESQVEITMENDTLRYFAEQFDWKTDLFPLGDGNFFIDFRDGYTVSFEKNKNNHDFTLIRPGREDLIFKGIPSDENLSKNNSQFQASYFNQELSVAYDILPDDNGLKLISKRNGSVMFTPIGQNEFKSTHRVFTRIKFEKDKHGKVLEMKISNDKLKDVVFEKMIKPMRKLEN